MKGLDAKTLGGVVKYKQKKFWYDVPHFPDPSTVAFRLDHLFIISKLNISLFPQVLFFNGIMVSE